jgi:hypothetical protein
MVVGSGRLGQGPVWEASLARGLHGQRPAGDDDGVGARAHGGTAGGGGGPGHERTSGKRRRLDAVADGGRDGLGRARTKK